MGRCVMPSCEHRNYELISFFSPNLTEEEAYVLTFCLPYSASCLSTGSTLTLQRFAHLCGAPALLRHWQGEELLPPHPQSNPTAIDPLKYTLPPPFATEYPHPHNPAPTHT